MITIIALTVFLLVFIVLIGLLARREDRLRDTASPTGVSQDGH